VTVHVEYKIMTEVQSSLLDRRLFPVSVSVLFSAVELRVFGSDSLVSRSCNVKGTSSMEFRGVCCNFQTPRCRP